jgi:hypothetical protein
LPAFSVVKGDADRTENALIDPNISIVRNTILFEYALTRAVPSGAADIPIPNNPLIICDIVVDHETLRSGHLIESIGSKRSEDKCKIQSGMRNWIDDVGYRKSDDGGVGDAVEGNGQIFLIDIVCFIIQCEAKLIG